LILGKVTMALASLPSSAAISSLKSGNYHWP